MVLSLRAGEMGGETEGQATRRVPKGLAFMMTHSYAEDRADGEYKRLQLEYREKKEPLMTECRAKVGEWVNHGGPRVLCSADDVFPCG